MTGAPIPKRHFQPLRMEGHISKRKVFGLQISGERVVPSPHHTHNKADRRDDMSDTRELTQEERRLLEDCPRREAERVIDTGLPTLVIWHDGVTDNVHCGPSEAKRGAYIPTETVRAWLVEQDEREASKMVSELRRYPDEVGEGPWRVDKSARCWFVIKGDERVGSAFWYFGLDDFYDETEALQLAEAERNRLNAIWRTEERARRRDIAHGEALENDRLRSEPLTDELRARLGKRLGSCIKHFLGKLDQYPTDIDERGELVPFGEHVTATASQARAFLREKGIEVPND